MCFKKRIIICKLFFIAICLIGFSSCFGPVITSSEYEENKKLAYEAFALDEFPNMQLIEVKRDVFFPVYLVSTAEEFNNIRKYKDRSYIITNDIDLSNIENFEPIGSKEEPFTGEITASCVQATKDEFLPGAYYCADGARYRSNDLYRIISNIN